MSITRSTKIMFASSMLVIVISILIANMFTITLTMQQSFAAPLTSQAAIPSNNIVTTTSTYEIMFTTATTGPIKTIEVGYSSGYNVGSAKLVERIGIGAGTISANQMGFIYTVTSPVNVAAGTPVRLELASITNTNTAGNAAISITTKSATGTVIDGPTTASIPIKNIGTRDIGDGSVARQDIGNNAITSAKVNPALMYMKTKAPAPCDPTNVGMVGWCPDGVSRQHFIIPDSNLVSGVPVVVSLNFITPGPQPLGCNVFKVSPSIEFFCITPPLPGTHLRYIVQAPAQLP